MKAIELDPEVYRRLDDMETDLVAIIQSRAVPDQLLPMLRCALETIRVATRGTAPSSTVKNQLIFGLTGDRKPTPIPLQTWVRNPDDGGDAA